MTGPLFDKLPGDDAPPIEPPPHLKARIMAVVRAEAAARGGASAPSGGALEVPATVSVAAASAGEARLLLRGDTGTLEARALPPAPPGGAYRLWLLRGAEPPRLPEPGPVLEVGADGCGRWELDGLRGVHELIVAVERPRAAGERAVLLRVRLPRRPML